MKKYPKGILRSVWRQETKCREGFQTTRGIHKGCGLLRSEYLLGYLLDFYPTKQVPLVSLIYRRESQSTKKLSSLSKVSSRLTGINWLNWN